MISNALYVLPRRSNRSALSTLTVGIFQVKTIAELSEYELPSFFGMDPSSSTTAPANASKPKKRFVGKTKGPKVSSGVAAHQISPEILNDVELNEAIQLLPSNYSFEIHKTVHHVRKNGATMVGLQMPEGLQMFACTISDIVERSVSFPIPDMSIGSF